MAIGDDALAAGMSLVDGATVQADDIDLEINRTRDYIAQRTNAITPISKGGTNATTAAAARSNLSVPSVADLATKANVSHSHQVLQAGTGKSFGWNAGVGASGGWNTGNTLQCQGPLLLPNAVPSAGAATLCYIQNSDGRVSAGVSSLKYKKNVTDADVSGDLFGPAIREYEMKDGGGYRFVGYIAEELAVNDATHRFVVFKDGEPEAIDYVQYLLAQVAQLAQRVADLEAR